MDTTPMAFDASEVRRRYPSVPVTSLADVVRRDFVGGRNVDRNVPRVVTP